MSEFDRLRHALERAGQAHVLNFWGRLSDGERRSLLDQITSIDLERLTQVIERFIRNQPKSARPKNIEPPITYALDGDWDRKRYKAIGENLIAAGKVAAFVVAGGQGSRLGFDGPKGCFPVTPVTGKSLFQVFAEGILATQLRYRCTIPWFIMTSPQNDSATVEFFTRNDYFGLDPRSVRFFTQGQLPSFDRTTGKLLLAGKGEIAMNPDGHGGSILALHRSGSLDEMRSRGIEHLSYFQVDNPLVRVIDPVFIGLHAAAPDSSAEMSSKMISKAYPLEKIGLLCRVNGRTTVIEYSDLPDDIAHEQLPDGSLRFGAGNPAIHMMSVEFLSRVGEVGEDALPLHRAEKKVPCIDPDTGEPINPDRPNAVKLERFVFDALPHCGSSIVVESDRDEEFAPVKNASGIDSLESSQRIQIARAARWLERAGVQIPRRSDGSPDCVIEISPLTALDADDLIGQGTTIKPGARVLL